jgi:hypothetical protein
VTEKDAFLDAWQRRFGRIPPIAYVLKWKLPERWVRVHSLPKSERYAKTEADWGILVDRHFKVLQAVIDKSSDYFVVTNSFERSKPNPVLTNIVHLGSFSDGDEDNREYPIDAYLCTPPKSAAEMAEIFKLAADDELRFFFMQDGKIFAPYDGGIDIILETLTAANALKSKFGEWLSKEPSGL